MTEKGQVSWKFREEENSSSICAGWSQKRYIMAVMGFLCLLMQYVMKVNLSVGIVAMVRSNFPRDNSTSANYGLDAPQLGTKE
ncbi:hypothetical protein J437_LFUL019040, partial [Ladona fulva]